ncbi:hypothetical protein ABID58_001201 [Bradyrhizobium sp. S3.2.6]|uniref:hypothetical protein n=1 Tax=Bradyrhizobium sp. S3.2.6 TaxID=3156428 RepID=UPI003397BA30
MHSSRVIEIHWALVVWSMILPENRFALVRIMLERSSADGPHSPGAKLRFDTSGKTLAEWHHQKFVETRAEKSTAGFFMRERRLP